MSISRISLLHYCRAAMSTKASPLYKLRQKTGLAYNLCREALDKHQNNIEEAEAWLKAQALAHGLQKASKVGGRSAREGLIGLSIRQDNHMATVVELNCETDFVARNQMFKDFLIDLTDHVSSDLNHYTKFAIPDSTLIEGMKPNESKLKEVEHEIAPLITKLGENIKLTRIVNFKANEDAKLFGQIHVEAARKTTSQHEIIAGRFGAIVGLRLLETSSGLSPKAITAYANRLCQHVIGYSPSYIELPENVRKHLEEAEKQAQKTKQDQQDEEELSDHEGFQPSQNMRDDWPSMMDQTLIMSDDLSVREFCKSNGFSIVFFNRFECGAEA